MPAFLSQNDRLGGLTFGQHRNSLIVNAGFHALTLAVQIAQSLCQIRCFFRIVCQEQIHGKVNLPHAAGGIDARCQHKADGGGGNSFLCAAAFFHQCGNAGATGVAQGLQTLIYKHAVFTLQQHHIRNSAKANHVGIFFQYGLLIAAEGSGQLESHADTGKILVGIATIRTVRIHNGDGFGERFFTFVVVSDDQIDAQIFAQARFINCGDAAVNGDDQLHTFVVKLIDGNGV